MKILFVGDFKGNFLRGHKLIEGVLKEHPDIKSVYQTGDCGYLASYRADLTKFNNRLKHNEHDRKLVQKLIDEPIPRFSKPVEALQGDFDDPSCIDDLKLKKANYTFLPKADIFGVNVLYRGMSFGGIENPFKTRKFAEKVEHRRFITESDWIDVSYKLKKHSKATRVPMPIDFLFTHQAPKGIGPVGSEGSEYVRRIMSLSDFKYVVHGHHHLNYEYQYYGTKIIGLGTVKNLNSYKILEF
jgi:Icc-related predicted phosphoesterase